MQDDVNQGARPAPFSPPPPRVLAHRGLATHVPENTIAAFREAIEAGARHLETDVHASADRHAVLWHDPELERFDGSETRIAHSTLEQLREHRVGEHTLCTAEEAFAAFPDASFNIDLKDPRAAAPLAAAIERSNAWERVLVTSFSERNLTAFRRLLPRGPTGASRSRVLRALLAIELRDEKMLARLLRNVEAVQIPERAAGMTLISPQRLAAFKRHVREVHVWTVNDPADMRRLLSAGVDGIVSDRADLAVPIVQELSASR